MEFGNSFKRILIRILPLFGIKKTIPGRSVEEPNENFKLTRPNKGKGAKLYNQPLKYNGSNKKSTLKQKIQPSVDNVLNKKKDSPYSRKAEKSKIKLEKLRAKSASLKTYLQIQPQFEINIVDKNLFLKIIKEPYKDQILNIPTEIKNKREKAFALREKERKDLITRRQEVLEYSLLKIHYQREVERLEKEKEEQEKRIQKEFKDVTARVQILVERKEYSEAIKLLGIKINEIPDKESELSILKKQTLKEFQLFKANKKKFEEIKKKAEASFHTSHYTQAIALFKEAQILNINNSYCRQKIGDCKLQAKRKAERENERQRQEIERQKQLNFKKEDSAEILALFRQKGINKLYHFTDSRNINSIIQQRGLYSWKYNESKGINSINGGDSTSRNLDIKYGLENYVRMTYNNNNPMLYIAKKEGRIRSPIWLEIKTEVAILKDTEFSDMNATKTGFRKGNDISFLKDHVRFDVVKWDTQFHPITKEKSHFFQAEILVKEHVPLEYILNLK